MFAIRSGNFQLSLMLATALVVSVWPAAGHAYTPEGSLVQRRDSGRRARQGLPAQEQGAA